MQFELDAVSLRIAERTLCKALTLDMASGQIWGVLGRNGAGKSTLIRCMAGLVRPASGEIRLDGKVLADWQRAEFAHALGVLPQDSQDTFPSTVLETALIGRHPHISRWSMETQDDYDRVRAALAAVGLEAEEQRDITTLSGGERRRLAVATLLAQDPTVFLLDEPLNHLDIQHQLRVLTLFSGLARAANKIVVAVMHDINMARRFCTHVILMRGDGEAAHGEVERVLTLTAIENLYQAKMREIETEEGPIWLPELTTKKQSTFPST